MASDKKWDKSLGDTASGTIPPNKNVGLSFIENDRRDSPSIIDIFITTQL
jgi:hypothetical protein